LPKEVIAADYTTKLEQGLHNDADTKTYGQGLYYENGELHVGVHPSTAPDLTREDHDAPMPQKVINVDSNNGKAPDEEK